MTVCKWNELLDGWRYRTALACELVWITIMYFVWSTVSYNMAREVVGWMFALWH